MHIEILVEDKSGKILLGHVIPKILGPQGSPHTWRLHGYRGIGSLPKGLKGAIPPDKRILLDRLPDQLKAYGKTPGVDAVVVVVDNDDRNCAEFLGQLKRLLNRCDPPPKTLFRLAMEEIEAWYLGDRAAIRKAYPSFRGRECDGYLQDSCCGTWEVLADAIHPGGSRALKRVGWPVPGQVKCDWADRIGPLLDINGNQSPSFRKLRDGLRRIAAGG
jgi:hypothetical protein